MSIIFLKKDLILALAVLSLTLCDYFVSGKKKIYFNEKEQKFDTNGANSLNKTFTFFFEKFKENLIEENEIVIEFEKEQTWEYSKQILTYIIDENHKDSFFRDLELKKWEEKNK